VKKCVVLYVDRNKYVFSRYSDWLRTGQSGDRTQVGARFFESVQIGPGAHPASCTMGTVSFQGGKERPERDADPSPHPLVPWSRNSRAIPLLPLWAVRPVQSLSACTTVHFTFLCTYIPFQKESAAYFILNLAQKIRD